MSAKSAASTGHLGESDHAPVPCEVLNNAGHWVSGYELLCFRDDGLLTIRSTRTGAIRHLPADSWRDPVEEDLLEAAASRR